MQGAAPLIQTLAVGGVLQLFTGKPTSAVVSAMESAGVQHRIAHLKVSCCEPTACFWQAASHSLKSVRTVTLEVGLGFGATRCWDNAAWAGTFAYVKAIPGPVELMVQSWGIVAWRGATWYTVPLRKGGVFRTG
jgi:hypothetical protein